MPLGFWVLAMVISWAPFGFYTNKFMCNARARS
jgi:hypothetical protein